MANRPTMAQWQSGSVSFTQCHYCKETRWLASGVCHPVKGGVFCWSVVTHSVNAFICWVEETLICWFGLVLSLLMPHSRLLSCSSSLCVPWIMCRSTCVFLTTRWPIPTNASATLWQYMMAAGDSDIFLYTFSLFCLIPKISSWRSMLTPVYFYPCASQFGGGPEEQVLLHGCQRHHAGLHTRRHPNVGGRGEPQESLPHPFHDLPRA